MSRRSLPAFSVSFIKQGSAQCVLDRVNRYATLLEAMGDAVEAERLRKAVRRLAQIGEVTR